MGDVIKYKLLPQRYAWLQVVKGAVTLNDQQLHTGDGAAVSEQTHLALRATEDAEILLFDLA